MARFNKYSTARSTGLSWSYGLLPILIYSMRFDQSGIASVTLTVLILLFSTVNHVWVSDWAYQFYLLNARRKYVAQRKLAVQKHR